MKIFLRVGAFIYVAMVLSLCCLIFFYVFGIFDIDYVMDYLKIYSLQDEYVLAIGIILGVLMFLTILFYRIFLASFQQDKVIAFDNPSGRVSVSLLALEDLVKRKVSKLYQVRDVKTKIRAAGRRGLQVKITLVICAEGHIPDITSEVQDMVKNKIQDVIGLDEAVNIYVYIGKILPDESHSRQIHKEEDDNKSEPNIPFQGYRA